MKKKTVARKGVAVVLTAALLAPTSAFAAVPSDFSDFPNDWSTQAMTEAVENGLLGGVSDGVIAPSGLLTRAQMAAIINRAFGATETASLSGYTDVAQSDWYYTDMAMAVQMGTFVGEGGGRLNPNSAITREEAFCVLARAFSIDTASASTLSQFSDNSAVSSWAREAVAGMIANGCVSGYEDGTLRPQGTITRAEFASVMSRLVDQYISEAGNVTTDEDGNVLVRAAGVTLSDMTIDGDLILADGIGTGDVTLDGVTVEGRLLIRGGGSDSIHITDSTIKGGIILNNPNTATRIVPQNSDLGEINVQSDLVVDGDVDTITVSSAADVTVDGGTVSKIVVSAAADDATITVNDGATVDTIEANADGVSVSGDGEVTSVTANANDITVTTTDTEVTAAEGTSGVTAGGVEVPAGETVVSGEGTTTEEPDTDRPGGTTGGGTIRPPAVEEEQAIEVDSWQELRNAVQTVEAGGTIRLTADIKDAGADVDAIDGVSSATLPMESEEGKYFTLDGDGHSITAAADRTFCFLISSVGGETVVKDLTIDGASFSSKMGGAFFVEGGDALFQNVTFKNCVAGSASATNGGGAILVNNHGSNAYPNVTIENCTFEDNKVGEGTTGRGGAVYANNLNTTPGDTDKERIVVTIKDSTFSGNQAAYGAAIAADGNVDLTVENCDFTEQEGTDIYIYEGVSAGKKSMSIYSNVNATLSGNTNAQAIYSRYYPADFDAERNSAPDGAEDITYADIDRTYVAGEAIEVDSWAELKQAIQKVENGGTIRLTADIKDAGADTTVVDGVSSATLPMESEEGKYFTLDGDGHTIRAEADKTFCFLISSVGGETVVKDLTIDGASFSSKMGGAFFVEGGEAAFQNVVFKNCTAASASATNGGGAILVNNHGGNAYPNVTIEGCTFEGNKAGDGTTGRGGAVYANNFNTTPGDTDADGNKKERIKVTIKGSTFSGNQAAYGTAIAADGNVDLTVEDCTFTNQDGDDIYIYEGASAGKKNRTIYSNVIATLTDNTDATAIYSRYYPASYSVDRGTAPEGAEDVTFGNIERTQERGTLIPMDIAGHTYYYGSATYEADGSQYATFTVDGETVEAQKIGEANAYFYAKDPFEDNDVVYAEGGTMSYADFYAELADDAEGIDAVSSATSSKNTIFTYADSTTPDDSGYKINGVKNLPVEVNAAQYAQGTILEALHQLTDTTDAGQKAASELANTAISEKPGVYTSMNASGEYSNKLTVNDAKKTTVNSANLEIETSSRWGDYLLKVIETDTENLRNDRNTGWPVGENILGAIVTATKDDKTMNVGMKHLQNIWVQPYEIAFTLADSDQFAALEGATVTQITYIVPEGTYVYNFTKDNYIKPQYEDVELSASFNEDKTQVTITGIPEDLTDVKVNIYQNKGHGQKTMIATGARPVGGVVTLDETAQVDETVTYTVQITSSNYADLQTTVTAAEAVEPGEGEQTRTGEATVQTYGYTAKVTVVYDPVTGKIVSVSDNDTDAGGNSMFWNYLSSVNTHEGNAFWAQFEGLDRAGVEALQINPTGSTQNTGEDNVDAVSGATYSSAAVKQAVLNALPS